jgi:hypothetical protein
MIIVSTSQFSGTLAELQARVDAFRQAVADHALTVGVPAPREEDFIENIVRTGGAFTLVDANDPSPEPVTTFAERRLAACAVVDSIAETVRLRYITPGAGQAATYLIKERQAEDFKAAGYTGTVPGMVQVEADATGSTAQQACDSILAQRDAWVAKAAQIEGARRSGKVSIDAVAADDDASLISARDAAINALEAL